MAGRTVTRFGDYAGKLAIVTGASSGIGAELARQLASRGSHVALVARRQDRLTDLAQEIAGRGGRASIHPCDVAKRAQVEVVCQAITSAHGPADLLVNNAGFAQHLLFKDHDVADIERMMQTNYLGSVYWIKAVLPAMRARSSGWIINFSSFAGKIGQADEAAYSATKFAISGLSEALAAEFAPLGIGVLCVHPVLVRTEMFTPEVMSRMPGNVQKRFMEADAFCAEVLRALDRGESDVVIPRAMRWVPILRSLFPRSMSRAIARVKLGALPDVTD